MILGDCSFPRGMPMAEMYLARRRKGAEISFLLIVNKLTINKN